MCAMLYIIENGCKQRALPKKYGKWHTIEIGLITKLHLCYTSSCPVVFSLSPGNSYNAPAGIKLIESIYPTNNHYLLMDRTHVLAKVYGFRMVVPPKKIVSFLGFMINKFKNKAIISNSFSIDGNALEKFLLVTTNLILFLALPSLSLLFSTYSLYEH